MPRSGSTTISTDLERGRGARVIPGRAPGLSGLSPEALRDIVRATARHALRLIQPSGQFIYAHEFRRPDRVIEGYNLMRHAGTLWFLLAALKRLPLPLDRQTGEKLGTSLGWLLRQLRVPPRNWGALPMLDLVEGGRTKTGGAALVLLVLAEWQDALVHTPRLADYWPQGVPPAPELMIRLRNAILRERGRDDFNHMRDLATGRPLPFRSDYYTGQALLALIRTGSGDKAAPVLLARLAAPAPAINHWLLYAAAEAIRQDLPEAEAAWAWSLREMAAHIARPLPGPEAGSISVACASEGLLAVLRAATHLGKRESFAGPLLARLEAQAQVQLLSYGEGQFCLSASNPTVQIDALQHNAESLLGLAEELTKD